MFCALVYVLGVLLLTDVAYCLCPLLLSFSVLNSGQIYGRPDTAAHRLQFRLNTKFVRLTSAMLNLFSLKKYKLRKNMFFI